MALRTYSIYTQCEHCGVYDLDAEWCDLCGKPKSSRRESKPAARDEDRDPPPVLRPSATRAAHPE